MPWPCSDFSIIAACLASSCACSDAQGSAHRQTGVLLLCAVMGRGPSMLHVAWTEVALWAPVSSGSNCATTRRRKSGSVRQCTKSNSCHDCVITHGLSASARAMRGELDDGPIKDAAQDSFRNRSNANKSWSLDRLPCHRSNSNRAARDPNVMPLPPYPSANQWRG